MWTRAGSSGFTDAVVRLGKTLLRRPAETAPSQEERAAGRREMARRPLVRAVWSALVLLDLLWQYTWRVRLPLLVGRVVICDRYTYDAIADVAAATGSSRGLFGRLLTALSPRPALSFLVVVPAQEAERRLQGELSAAALEGQDRLYAALAKEYNLRVVDGAQPFAAVNDPLVRETIIAYYRRYRTLINGLFMANPMAGVESITTDERR